jgi:hypothetical protein
MSCMCLYSLGPLQKIAFLCLVKPTRNNDIIMHSSIIFNVVTLLGVDSRKELALIVTARNDTQKVINKTAAKIKYLLKRMLKNYDFSCLDILIASFSEIFNCRTYINSTITCVNLLIIQNLIE